MADSTSNSGSSVTSTLNGVGQGSSSGSAASANSIAAANAQVNGLIQSAKVNTTLQKPPYDGKLDKNGEVRLRLATVDNPLIKRTSDTVIDPLDPYNIVNLTTGQITVKWSDQDGGVVRGSDFGTYGNDGENSDRESLKLTHPIMWANANNWFGINYLPPVGSLVVIGFRKYNLPVMLGFVQPHYEVMYPIELGEMMNKGFGNNTTHWKMHDEIEQKVWVTEGQSRPVGLIPNVPGRKYNWQNAPYTVQLGMRMKAWIDPKNPDDKKEMIELTATRSDGSSSMIELRPESVQITSGSSISTWTNGSIHHQTGSYVIDASSVTINGSGAVTVKGGAIYLN